MGMLFIMTTLPLYTDSGPNLVRLGFTQILSPYWERAVLALTGLLVNSYVCLYVSQDQMVDVKVSRWTGRRRPIKRY